MAERVSPFGDLSDFQPRDVAKELDPKVLDTLAETNGFPSRHARTQDAAPAGRTVRRYTTGRNKQINVKATDETIQAFYSVADELNQPLGAVLQMALEALSRERARSTE